MGREREKGIGREREKERNENRGKKTYFIGDDFFFFFFIHFLEEKNVNTLARLFFIAALKSLFYQNSLKLKNTIIKAIVRLVIGRIFGIFFFQHEVFIRS